MKERPISLNAPMSLAAILGHKTETRRPMKPQPIWHSSPYPDGSFEWQGGTALKRLGFDAGYVHEELAGFRRHAALASPLGSPGTGLWLREPGRVVEVSRSEEESVYFIVEYLADKKRRGFNLPERFDPLEVNIWPSWVRPGHGIPNGIFREAARYFSEVLTVRVERLQDITEEGAEAEGVLLEWYSKEQGHGGWYDSFREAFEDTWNSIYGKRPGLSWEDNPWVWVTGFKPMEPRT